MVTANTPVSSSLIGALKRDGIAWHTFRVQEIRDCQAAQVGGDQGRGTAGQIALQLLAGILLWLVTLSLAVGFATFAFLRIPNKTPLAISMQIQGSAVSYLWLGMRSMNPSSCVQASPVPAIYISAFVEAAQARKLPPTTEISTVLLFVWLTTFTQGVAFMVCSRYSMGEVLQYFPRSVKIGYNGGIGLLILNAALSMLSGVNPLQDMDAFLQTGPVLLTLPGVLVALVVYGLSLNRTLAASPAFKVVPIISVTLAFYVVLCCQGVQLEEAREAGWVFSDSGWMSPTDVVYTFQPSAVDWCLLQRQTVLLLPPMLLISMVAQYASLGAVLLHTVDSTKDADNETRHLGCASRISGLMGAMPTLSGMGPTSVLLSVVGKRGASGACLIVCGTLHLILFLSGFPLVAFVPKCSIAGCLLMPISFKMIRGALFDSLATSTWSDYLIIWIMSWTTLLVSIQRGLLSGFVLTVFQLIYEYAHFDIVSRRESIRDVCTVKERPPQVQQVLRRFGDEFLSFRLQGVLFFANCVSFKLELQHLLQDPEERPPKFIVVDFTEVVYADSSVWDILANFSIRAQDSVASEVFLCALGSALLEDLSRQGMQLQSSLKMDHLQHSYLHTLEQLEDKMLRIVTDQEPGLSQANDSTDWCGLVDFVACGFLQDTSVVDRGKLETKLQQYFSKVDFETGELVQQQGCFVDSFYFVCSGEFHVLSSKPAASRRQPGTRSISSFPVGFPSGNFEFRHDSDVSTPSDDFVRTISGRVVQKAYLHRKLVAGFIEGVEMFCHEDGFNMMEAYTSVQCKSAGTLLCLPRDNFQQMRKEDSELCVAMLLSTSSHREVLRRRHVLNGFEPEEVEVVEGAQRAFTKPFISTNMDALRKRRRSKMALLLCVGGLLLVWCVSRVTACGCSAMAYSHPHGPGCVASKRRSASCPSLFSGKGIFDLHSQVQARTQPLLGRLPGVDFFQ